MCYRIVVLMLLMLLVALPVMNALAAPAPDPYAILDIGPPPKGETSEQYRKRQIELKTFDGILNTVRSDADVRKLRSFASMKNALPWLAKNLRVKSEGGERRLRFNFLAGNRNEQVIIINAFVRASLVWNDVHGTALKCNEEWLRVHEKNILELEQRIKATTNPQEIASFQEAIHNLRTIQIPGHRAEIARLKQYAVLKWAR